MFDSIYLTGFKKFGNHEVNPTEMVACHFIDHPIAGVFCQRLDVITQEVDNYVNSVKQCNNSGKCVLNLHFGVGPNQVYKLESCGYNNKDFGIPDNQGNVYHNEKICQQKALDEPIKCKLNLEHLKQQLQKKHQVVISTDPGRYLCNYVYYKSLLELGSCEKSASLFVHFPVLAIKSHQQNVSFVTDLIGLLLKQEQKKEEKHEQKNEEKQEQKKEEKHEQKNEEKQQKTQK